MYLVKLVLLTFMYGCNCTCLVMWTFIYVSFTSNKW